MKIGIITQSLQGNYGGILQNYALQKTLEKLGHNPITIDQLGIWIPNRYKDFVVNFKNFIYNILYGKKKMSVGLFLLLKERALIESQRFIQENIKVTPKCWGFDSFRKISEEYKFDAYVVGSDQVWRPKYAPNIGISFLDFTNGYNVKRIAYAASFGVDTWEFDKEQTDICKNLASKFDAISVREDSGVILCKAFLDVEAEQVLDPTLLLSKDDYNALLTPERESDVGQIFTYILDDNQKKRSIVEKISLNTRLEPFSVNQEEPFSFIIPEDEKKRYYPSVQRWLKAFRDSKYIVCDSFHGAVFSIIYNKQFVILANDKRGNARFSSLLKLFGLEERLANNEDDAFDKLMKPIDWILVNSKKSILQEKSMNFLIRNLNG